MITCEECGGECCKMLVEEIDTPDTKDDFDDILWYLYHPGVWIYFDKDNEWNMYIKSKCMHLGEDNKCKIYETRPPICRKYKMGDCDHDWQEVDTWFRSPDDFKKWLETSEEYKKLCEEEKNKKGKSESKEEKKEEVEEKEDS